ncbi:MalY/PatB family protein [Saccharibacillus alkalitolerans]|uniref:cysteine-S-conjugate beta-lyase n=1 Tax=Saccharibacillus alkalitolerans TaxID=2705290 RepID=A0ABX0F677_9BACL|nr:MalY/PatB family protein [Saccharibacillus alkalitolerans]NGZ75108.1 pyridoxal phosphate-dependent aminotransferase [Saccharibacillus alkalitolerans]
MTLKSRFDFHTQIDRLQSASEKWDGREKVFGAPDALPLWVADMDFAAPQEVLDAMRKRVDHGVFGYTFRTPAYFDAVVNWMKERHDWTIDPEWITFTPGVVPALAFAVEAFTKPGDKIAIQTPVYPPFYNVVRENGRQLVMNPLTVTENGGYEMDFEDLELKLADDVKMLILCSPHNPVGRIWSRADLEKLAEICLKHDVLVVADEIHADLIFEPKAHVPFASVSDAARDNCLVCTAPSKTFNLAGLSVSNIVIPSRKLRVTFQRTVAKMHGLGSISTLGATATEAAYTHGGEWLDELLAYVRGNMEYVRDQIEEHLPELSMNLPEATYLLWIDFRGLNLNAKELMQFLLHKAGIALNDGTMFGLEGAGYMRMNVACSRSIVEQAMEQLKAAVAELRSGKTD